MLDYRGGILSSDSSARGQSLVINFMSSLAVEAADIAANDNFDTVLESNVAVSTSSINSCKGRIKSKPSPVVDCMTLAKRWNNLPANKAK